MATAFFIGAVALVPQVRVNFQPLASTSPASAMRDGVGSFSAATAQSVALRATVNNRYVTAENAGSLPLIANRAAIGSWEKFDMVQVGATDVTLRAQVDHQFVCAENGGAAPLLTNRDVAGKWETFELIRNNDDTVSLRARANGRIVTAENAGRSPLVANRAAIGPWEKFQLVPLATAPPATTGQSPTACPAGQVGTAPSCLPVPPAPLASGKKWQILFNDDFNGSALNTSNFSPCFDWNYGDCTNSFNTGREHYDPGQVQVGGGTAKLIAAPMSPSRASNACFQGSCTYKSGLISTARPRADNGSAYLHPFTYGYVESRMKYPAVRGMFTAFWMLPTSPSYSYRNEIDIVEILGGDPSTVFMTYHYNDRATSVPVNRGDRNNGACAVKDYSTGFVRFGLDWEPTHVAWYIDGVKCGQFDGNSSTIENGPMQIILNMMVDNKWERDWGLTLANQSVTSQLEVDYLRVYQQR